MSTAVDRPAAPLLGALPEELCLAVIEELDISSIIALSQTSQRFSRLANPTDESRRSIMNDFLIEAQAFPRWQRDGFACFACTKVLPRSKFADKQTKGKRGRNGSQQDRRFCIQCGVEKGHNSPGSIVTQGDSIRMVCRGCKSLQGGQFCDLCKFCRHCRRLAFPLRSCERNGHKIIGDALPSGRISQDPSVCLATTLGLGFYTSEYEILTGETASPEWFDDPDNIGP